MYNRCDLLSDLNILDLSRIFTGPFASQILGDLGANIIKIEPPGGDDTRYWGPPYINSSSDLSSYFASLNRNKKSIELNLKEKSEYEIFVKLVGLADVIIENYSQGVSKKLKVDYETLVKINPKIIYLSISGFGTTGPYSENSSYDIIAQSESGIMSITGTETGEFAKVGVPIADISAGLYGVVGILTAIINKNNTSKGMKIETDLFSGLTSWLTYQSMNSYFSDQVKEPKPMGTAHPNIVPYQSFLCNDNKWISLAVGNDNIWKRLIKSIQVNDSERHLLKKMNSPKFATNSLRVENRNELIPMIQQIFLNQSSNDWFDLLRQFNIPVGRVNSIKEVLNHPQMEHNKQVEYLASDNAKIPIIKTPIHFTEGKVLQNEFPPAKDGHREEILGSIDENSS